MSKDNPKPTAYDQAITMYEKSADTVEGFATVFWLVALVGCVCVVIGAGDGQTSLAVLGITLVVSGVVSALACSACNRFIKATMFKFMHENRDIVTTVPVEPETKRGNSSGVLDDYDRI